MDLHDIVLTGPEVQVAKVATLFVRVCLSEILPKSHSHFDMAPIAAVVSGFRNFRTVSAFVLFVLFVFVCFFVTLFRCVFRRSLQTLSKVHELRAHLPTGEQVGAWQWKKRVQLVELSIHSGNEMNEHALHSTRF